MMHKNYRYNRSTKKFGKGGSNYQSKGEVWESGKPKNPKLSQTIAATVGSALGGIGAALSIPNYKRQALKAAKKGDFTTAQDLASQIKRDPKALKVKRKITSMENQAGSADFKRRGGTKRRRK
jgi:hypothetical protein